MNKLEPYKKLGITTLLVFENIENIFEELKKDPQILKFNGLRKIMNYYFNGFGEEMDFDQIINESLPKILSKSEEEIEELLDGVLPAESETKFYYYLDDNSCDEFDVCNNDYEWMPEKDFAPDVNTLVIDLSTFLSIVKDN